MGSHSNQGGWQSPQGRRARLCIAVFLLLNLGVPLLTMDLYPFSRGPMFSDAPQECCDYELFGPQGEKLDLTTFGLHRIYWGNPPGSGVGFFLPATLDNFGSVPDRAEVTTHLRDQLRFHPNLSHVEVVQHVLGDLNGNQVGIKRTERWRVENPVLQGRSD